MDMLESFRVEDHEMSEVNLIANGYEWTCPACEEDNKEIAITEIVTCRACATSFRVDEVFHARE